MQLRIAIERGLRHPVGVGGSFPVAHRQVGEGVGPGAAFLLSPGKGNAGSLQIHLLPVCAGNRALQGQREVLGIGPGTVSVAVVQPDLLPGEGGGQGVGNVGHSVLCVVVYVVLLPAVCQGAVLPHRGGAFQLQGVVVVRRAVFVVLGQAGKVRLPVVVCCQP